ncbi:MAG: hypothetical protein K6B43_01200 [Treponema sp.]|nr:hypothetical protein [Treponema sp.]
MSKKSCLKKSIFLFVVFFAAFVVNAQVSVSPGDKFYEEAQSWALRGVVEMPLPQLRPYPLSVIRKVLSAVIENDSGNALESDVALASEEYERIFGKKFHVFSRLGADGKISAVDENENSGGDDHTERAKNIRSEIGVRGDADLFKLVSLGYSLSLYGETKESFSDYAPLFVNKDVDSIYDASSIGPFNTYSNLNTNAQVGTDWLYSTVGISRIGFGDFLGDGLALNDGGYHSTNLVFNVTRDKWSFCTVLESIGATDNFGENLSDNKFLAFHSVRFDISKKFSLSYYENILFGPGFDLTYMFPAPFIAVQTIGGAASNLQMGLLFDYRPIPGLLWSTDLFIDDFAVNEIVKLDFDAKYRFALQSGLIYYPTESAVKKLSMNYTCVMPYVYSHWEYVPNNEGEVSGKSFNYQNYTNNALPIGSTLYPNSDAVKFNATFNPLKNLTLDLSTTFARHANSAEDFDESDAAEYVLSEKGQYATNGTAFMQQMFSGDGSGKHVNQAWEKLGFMTSDHKMYVCQAGLSAQYDFPKTKAGQFSLKLGYTFEYVRNANVNTNVYTGGTIDWQQNDDGTYSVANSSEKYATWEEFKSSSEVQNVVKEQLQDWIDQLYDEVNHYVSVSVKYQY